MHQPLPPFDVIRHVGHHFVDEVAPLFGGGGGVVLVVGVIVGVDHGVGLAFGQAALLAEHLVGIVAKKQDDEEEAGVDQPGSVAGAFVVDVEGRDPLELVGDLRGFGALVQEAVHVIEEEVWGAAGVGANVQCEHWVQLQFLEVAENGPCWRAQRFGACFRLEIGGFSFSSWCLSIFRTGGLRPGGPA